MEVVMSAKYKLWLYLLPMIVLNIQTGTADYTAEDVMTWAPWDWFKLGITIIGSVALSVRMFYDQSVAREAAQKQSIQKQNESTTIP